MPCCITYDATYNLTCYLVEAYHTTCDDVIEYSHDNTERGINSFDRVRCENYCGAEYCTTYEYDVEIGAFQEAYCRYHCIAQTDCHSCQTQYAPTLGGLTLCAPQRCCVECSGGDYICAAVETEDYCLDQSNWGCPLGQHVTDTYLLPLDRCGGANGICGRPVPCCLPSGGCVVRTYKQCAALGGEPSGTCYETCSDAEQCCPPPVPCCRCGECTMTNERVCHDDNGTTPIPANGPRDCGNSLVTDECKLLDRVRRPCRTAAMLPAPTNKAGYDGYYDLHTIAPAPKIEPFVDPPKHYRGYVWQEPWLRHKSHKRPQPCMKETGGFALQDDQGTLGACVPPGHGVFVMPYRTACELPSQAPGR